MAICKDMNKLQPAFRAKVERLLLLAKQAGLNVKVFETWRSAARQLQMFLTGKSKIKQAGMHGKGLAVDIVFIVNGKPSWKGNWDKLAALGKQAGLEPGHYWKFKDSAHFQEVK